jgi:hypothetical protein
MQNAEGGSISARSDDGYDGFDPIISDIVSLIGQVQASIKLIEAAIAIESPLSNQGNQEVAINVVVLDDVTPRYLNARVALTTCRASLKGTLHLLRDAGTSRHGTEEAAKYDRRSARLIGRA